MKNVADDLEKAKASLKLANDKIDSIHADKAIPDILTALNHLTDAVEKIASSTEK